MTAELSIGAVSYQARAAIDAVAGEARQRHLTLEPGQELVYAAKLAQAQAFVVAHALDAAAAVQAYVAAESSSGSTTAIVAANSICAAATAFHAGPGPAIEQARRAGKVAVLAAAAAADRDGIALALAAAVAALNSI